MSERFIPEHIDALRFAEQGLGLDGVVMLSDLPRLSALILPSDGKVEVNVTLGVDEQGVNFLKGHIEASVQLQCQRCLEALNYEIMSDFILGIINTLDEANALSAVYEPAIANEGQLALREMIEDEVILNLPIIPRHELNECKVKLPVADTGWKDDDKKDKHNPFDVLASLKHKE